MAARARGAVRSNGFVSRCAGTTPLCGERRRDGVIFSWVGDVRLCDHVETIWVLQFSTGRQRCSTVVGSRGVKELR